MKIGNHEIKEVPLTQPADGIYWNPVTNLVEVWKHKVLIAYSDKDVPNIDQWIDWAEGELK